MRWKPRKRERRAEPYVCRTCGSELELVGKLTIGVQIFKCPPCGTMDRRLPANRRVIPSDVVRPVTKGYRRAVVIVALELLAIAAIAAAAVVVLR